MSGNHKDTIYECKKCNNYGDFTKNIYLMHVNYSFKNYMSMSIDNRFITN